GAKGERSLGDLRERTRDVRQASDGSLYLLTDAGNGKILRVIPATNRQDTTSHTRQTTESDFHDSNNVIGLLTPVGKRRRRGALWQPMAKGLISILAIQVLDFLFYLADFL